MIALEVDNRFMDLGEAKIRMKFRNQIFYRDLIAQSYSFPVTVPLTATNMICMRYYHRLALSTTYDDIECWIWLGGRRWRKAMIAYRGFNDGFDIDLKVPEDPVLSLLRSVSTKDLEQEYDTTIEFDGGDTTEQLLTKVSNTLDSRLGSAEDTDIIFAPFRNTGIWGDSDKTYYGVTDAENESMFSVVPSYKYVNWYEARNTYPWLRFDRGLYSDFITAHSHFTALPYLVKVVEHLFDLVGYRVDGDVMRDPYTRRQVILNNSMGVTPLSWNATDVLATGADGVNEGPLVHPVKLKDLLPEFTGVELLLRLMQRYNCVPIFKERNTVTLRSMLDILRDPNFLDVTSYLVPSRQMEREAGEALQLQEEQEDLDDIRESSDVDLSRLIGTVNTVNDLGTLTPDVGDVALVLANNSYYSFNLVPSGVNTWEFSRENLVPADVEDSTTRNVGVGFTSMFIGVDDAYFGELSSPPDREWLVPQVKMKMSESRMTRLGASPIKALRLLNFHGMQADSVGGLYPMLSMDRYAYDGADVGGHREMSDQDNGIDARCYAPWTETLRDGRWVKRQIRLPLHQVMHFQWDLPLFFEGNKYLCREIDVEFTSTSMGIPYLDLLRLPPIELPAIDMRGVGDFDAKFNEGNNITGSPYHMAEQNNGQLILGGYFSGPGSDWMVRLNANGTLDTTFGASALLNNGVTCVRVDPNGKIMAAGAFTGTGKNRIARFTTMGSLDGSFDAGTTLNNVVECFVRQTNGKYIVAGRFTGTGTQRICRLNSNGTLDTSFDAGTTFNNTIKWIALQDDGKVIAVGDFTGSGTQHICRLNTDGTLDGSFDAGSTLGAFPYRTVIDGQGRIYVVGGFYGASTPGIARFNTDGSLDTSFAPDDTMVIPLPAGLALDIILDPDDRPVVVGNFNKPYAKNIARFNDDGSLDTNFAVHAFLNGSAQSIFRDSKGNYIVGGSFLRRPHVVRLSKGVLC